MLKFSEKELIFIKSAAAGVSGTQAAIFAGYPKASARVAAHRFLSKPHIVDAIEHYKKSPKDEVFTMPAKKIKSEPKPKKQKAKAITEVVMLPAKKPFFEEGQIPQAKLQNGNFEITHDTKTPLGFLISVMQSDDLDVRQRSEAAKAALPYMHQKMGDLGKKEIKGIAAKQAGKGRFSAQRIPQVQN